MSKMPIIILITSYFGTPPSLQTIALTYDHNQFLCRVLTYHC